MGVDEVEVGIADASWGHRCYGDTGGRPRLLRFGGLRRIGRRRRRSGLLPTHLDGVMVVPATGGEDDGNGGRCSELLREAGHATCFESTAHAEVGPLGGVPGGGE